MSLRMALSTDRALGPMFVWRRLLQDVLFLRGREASLHYQEMIGGLVL